MALQKIVTIQGETFFVGGGFNTKTGEIDIQKEAYVKVQSVSGTKENIVVNVETKTEYGKTYASYNFVPSMEGGNFIQQAYIYLKTLPEFAGAMDC
jgi:hypothetical protein